MAVTLVGMLIGLLVAGLLLAEIGQNFSAVRKQPPRDDGWGEDLGAGEGEGSGRDAPAPSRGVTRPY